MFSRELNPILGRETRQLHNVAPGVDGAEDRRDTGNVIRGDTYQSGVRFISAGKLDGSQNVGHEVLMA